MPIRTAPFSTVHFAPPLISTSPEPMMRTVAVSVARALMLPDPMMVAAADWAG